LNENNELNIVLINSPHRHDLAPASCVNQEVIKFNRQLNKIMRLQSKMKVLEFSLDRKRLTKHGLHLKSNGKKISLAKTSSDFTTVFHEEPVGTLTNSMDEFLPG